MREDYADKSWLRPRKRFSLIQLLATLFLLSFLVAMFWGVK